MNKLFGLSFKFDMKKMFSFALLVAFCFGSQALAQKGGLAGIDDGTKMLKEIFSKGKLFVIAVACVYFLYLVIMAFLERKSWTDVLMGLFYCIIAGGAALLADWAVGYYS